MAPKWKRYYPAWILFFVQKICETYYLRIIPLGYFLTNVEAFAPIKTPTLTLAVALFGVLQLIKVAALGCILKWPRLTMEGDTFCKLVVPMFSLYVLTAVLYEVLIGVCAKVLYDPAQETLNDYLYVSYGISFFAYFFKAFQLLAWSLAARKREDFTVQLVKPYRLVEQDDVEDPSSKEVSEKDEQAGGRDTKACEKKAQTDIA